jgi:hypothetical protein
MTDARHPERWLNDRRILRLSAEAYKLHSFAMMYAVSNRTDGRLDDEDFALLAGVDRSRVPELQEAGLLKWNRGKWLLTEFRDTQTSKSELDSLDNQRRRDRDKKTRKRAAAREAAAAAGSSPGEQSPGVSPGTPVGQDKDRTGRDAEDPPESPDDDLEEYFAQLNAEGTDEIGLEIAS